MHEKTGLGDSIKQKPTKNCNRKHEFDICFKDTYLFLPTHQVQHSVRMSRELGHLCEWWIFPHQDLVLGVAVCADLMDVNHNASRSALEQWMIWLCDWLFMWGCSFSPVRWHVWTRRGCRPASRCLYSVAPGRSECSRNEGIGRPFLLRRLAGRADEETRRWPLLQPGDRCTAGRVAGWSCSTPVTAKQKHYNWFYIVLKE